MNFGKLSELENRFLELEKLLYDQEVISDKNSYKNFLKEYGNITPLVEKYREYKKLKKQLDDLGTLIEKEETDQELKDLTESEKKDLQEKLSLLAEELEDMTSDVKISRDEAIVEIRAAAGGDESSLFAYDLFRMYAKYAEKKGWKTEIVDLHETGLKGFKEVIFTVEGKRAYDSFRYESGIHRVQRVPVTEASGRIHTSTVTVAVLPQIKEIEFEIKPEELKIERCRASGHGGQHLQKTESAIKIIHIPTGIIAQCQDERSQSRNMEKALNVLKSRLYDKRKSDQSDAISSERKQQIGRGERAEKIRTYNYLQNRVTDHRINFSIYNLENFLDGDMDEMLGELKKNDGTKTVPGNQ